MTGDEARHGERPGKSGAVCACGLRGRVLLRERALLCVIDLRWRQWGIGKGGG